MPRRQADSSEEDGGFESAPEPAPQGPGRTSANSHSDDHSEDDSEYGGVAFSCLLFCCSRDYFLL